MAAAPLVLKAHLALGSTSSNASDVSDEVLTFKITAKIDEVEVPATGTKPAHVRGGASDFAVTIGYLSNDIAGTLFTKLWTAITTGDKTLYFQGRNRSAAVSAANPNWSGTFVVTEATVGAAAEALSKGSATFPMTGAPTQATS